MPRDGTSFFVVGVYHPYEVKSVERPSLLPEGAIAVRLHSIGGWGMITTGKNLGEIIGALGEHVSERDGVRDQYTLDNPGSAFARPEAAYFRHPLQAGVWSFIVERLYTPIPPQARQTLRDAFERFQGPLTRTFHAKGGKLLAGSDAIIPGLVPGFALHRELAELVKAGLTPYEALRTATTRPFEYLGEADKTGTIEVGKRSDLILVDEDPLRDASGASKNSGVFVRGPVDRIG